MSKHHETRDRWRRIIREQQTSGLSAAAFCRRADISPWSYYSWRRRLRAEDTFTELTIAPNRPRGAFCFFVRLACRSGARAKATINPGPRLLKFTPR